VTPTTGPSPTVARLARSLTDRDPGDPFGDELVGWLATSARFRAFATTYRDKIHKKVRTASGAEALRDVRAELLAARRLLADDRLAVAYEAYGSGRGGPDLTVTYRAVRAVNLEVTRLRKPPEPEALGATIVAKLRQLPPSVPNVLVIASDRPAPDVDVPAAVRALRARADDRDDAFFERRGLESGRGFYERFLRLSAVVAWCDEAEEDERAALWANPSARISLPEPAGRACLGCFQASAPGA